MVEPVTRVEGRPPSTDLSPSEAAFVARAPAVVAFPLCGLAGARDVAERLVLQTTSAANLIRYLCALTLAAAAEADPESERVEQAMTRLSEADLVAWVEVFESLLEALPDDALGRTLRALHHRLQVEKSLHVREIINMRAVEMDIGLLTNLARLQMGMPSGGALEGNERALRRSVTYHRVALAKVLDELGPLLELKPLVVERIDGELARRELVGARDEFETAPLGLPDGESLPQGHVIVPREDAAPLDLHPLLVFHECYDRYKADPDGESREAFVYRGHAGRRMYYRGTRHSMSSQELAGALVERFGKPRRSSRLAKLSAVEVGKAVRQAWSERLEREGVDRGNRYVPSKSAVARVRAHLAQPEHPLLLIEAPEGRGKTSLLAHLGPRLEREGHVVLPLDLEPKRPLELDAIFEEHLGRSLKEVATEAAAGLAADEPAADKRDGDTRRVVVLIDHIDRHGQRDLLESAIRLASSWQRELPALCWVVATRSAFLAACAQDPIGAKALASTAIAPVERRGFDDPPAARALELPLLDDAERDRLYELATGKAEHRTLSALHQLKRATLEMIRHPGLCWLTTAAYREREVRSSAAMPDVLRRYVRKVAAAGDELRLKIVRKLAEVMVARRRESLSIDELIEAGDDQLSSELLSGGEALDALVADGVLIKSDGGGGPFAERRYRFSQALVMAHLAADSLEALAAKQLATRLEDEGRRGPIVCCLRQLLARSAGAGEGRLTRRMAEAAGEVVRPLLAELLAVEERSSSSARTAVGALASELAGTVAGSRAIFDLAAERYVAGQPARARALLEALLDSPLAGEVPVDYYLGRMLADDGEHKLAIKALRKAEKRVLKAKRDDPQAAALWDSRFSTAICEALIASDQPAKAEGVARKLFDRLQVAQAAELLLPCRLLLARAVAACGRADEAESLFARALETALQANRPVWLRRIRRALARHLARRGRLEAASQHMQRLTADAARRGAPLEQLELMLEADQLGLEPIGSGSGATAELTGAVQAAVSLGPSPMLARALMVLGKNDAAADRLSEAADRLRKAARLAEQFGEEPLLADALARLGVVLQERGEFPGALEQYTRSLELKKRLGQRQGLGELYFQIARIFRARGDGSKALQYFGKALELARELGDGRAEAGALARRASLLAAAGDEAGGMRDLAKAREVMQRTNDARGLGDCAFNEGLIHHESGRPERAVEQLSAALEHYQQAGDRAGLASCHVQLALIERERDGEARALEHFERAAAIHEARGDRRGLAAVYNNLGVLYDHRGDSEQAQAYYEKDLALTEELGDLDGMATSYSNLAILHYNQRNYVKTLYCLEKARELLKRLGDDDGLADCESKIARVKAKM